MENQTIPAYDISGKEPVLGDLPHDQVHAAISSGKFSLPMGQEVNVISPDGTIGTIPSENAAEAFNNGYKYATPTDLNNDKYGSTLDQTKAGLENVASSATLGLSTGLERLMGANPEDILGRHEAHESLHPNLSTAENIAGFVGSTLIPGVGEANLVKEAGLGAKGLAKLAGIGGESAGLLGKMGASAAQMGVETALMQGGDEVTKYFSQDPTQTADTAIASIGLSGLIGGGIGAPLGAVSPLWKAAKESALGKGLGEIKDDLMNSGMGGFTKKAISALGGVPEESIEKYIADREVINATPEFREIYDNYLPQIESIHEAVSSKALNASEAKSALNEVSSQFRADLRQKGFEASTAHSMAQKGLRTAQKELVDKLEDSATNAAKNVVDSVEYLHKKVVDGSSEAYKILENSGQDVPLENFYKKSEELISNLRDSKTLEDNKMADQVQAYVENVKKGREVKPDVIPGTKEKAPSDFFAFEETPKSEPIVREEGVKYYDQEKRSKATGNSKAGPTDNVDYVRTDHLENALKHDGTNANTGFEASPDRIREKLGQRYDKRGEADIKAYAKEQKVGGNGYIPPGGYEEPLINDTVSAVNAKRMIQGLDRNSAYDFNATSFDKGLSRIYKQLRYTLDDDLKAAIPEYRDAMKPLAEDTKLLKSLNKFGDEYSAARKISSMKKPVNYKYEMPLLQQLQERTGGDFADQIGRYADKNSRASLMKQIPEFAEASRAAETIRALKNPETQRAIEQLIAKTPEFQAHQAALQDLQAAIAQKNELGGITPANLESKLKAAMRGKFNVEKAIKGLPKMGGDLLGNGSKDLSEILENLRVKESLEGGHGAGSKNVNTWGALIGGLSGGWLGAGAGAVVGQLMDKNNHSVTKSILDYYIDHMGLPKAVGETQRGPLRLALAKMLDHTGEVSADAFKTMAHFASASVRGEKELEAASKNAFSSSASNYKPPSKDKIEKMDKRLKEIAANQTEMLKVGGNVGHYLPAHGESLGKTAMTAVNFLNSKRPVSQKQNPLDSTPSVDKPKVNQYHRLLNIAESPLSIIDHVKKGTLQLGDVQALNILYPGLSQKIVKSMTENMIHAIDSGHTIPYHQKVSLSLLMGQPMTTANSQSAMQSIMNANSAGQPTQAPGAPQKRPTSAAINASQKVNSLYQTPLQARSAGKREG